MGAAMTKSWSHFGTISYQKVNQKSMQKTMSKKHENNYKGSQNGAEIDAKTHKKSMPELVSKKIREIIQNHVSLKSEIIEIHWKNNGF